MKIDKNMIFTLTCFKCGSHKFVPKELPLLTIENNTYLMHEDMRNEQVVCSNCGLEDWIQNLVIKASLKKEVV